MNKDVIYIDVEDDVTAIIGKIKNAKEKIVAVVPPKRAGSLQSAVNLRLLDRMAKADKKKLVLITSNPALVALAANASIPVAKNLQSKPEIAEIPALAVDDGDDIIDGADLPVGDHAKSIKVKDNTREQARSDVIETIDIDGVDETATAMGAVAASKAGVKKVPGKNKIKVPNFDSFRKKLFLGIGGGVLLIGLLVWMFVFAPAATVIVTARTSPAPVSATVTLGGSADTNFEEGIISSVSQQDVREETIEFEATGTGRVGEEATGTVTIYNCDGPGFTVPAGSTFTSSGREFTSNDTVSVGATSGSSSACRSSSSFPGAGTGNVAVTAADIGAEYNLSARSYTVSGVSGDVFAVGSNMTGGSSRDVRVVSSDDIERARGDLIGRSTDEVREELIAQFTAGEKAIESSFTVERGEATSSPEVDEEVGDDGQATLTIETTYTIQALSRADLESFLERSLEEQIQDQTQQIYDTGLDSVGLANYVDVDGTQTVSLLASGRVGPRLEEADLKEQVKGKIFGEVQSSLEAIDGIQEVDVQFSYFWVRTVPNNTDKIQIEFRLENE